MTDRIDDYSSTRVPARDCVVSPIILILVGWPRLSRRIWVWLRHFHIPGQQPVLGLLTPSAASPGRVRVQQQRAARSRTFVPDPVHGLLRLRDLQLRADSQEAGGSTYKLTAYSDPSKARMSWWAGVR